MTPRKLSKRILVGPILRTQPDRRLVALAREGHGTAIDEIVRRYRPALLRYAATIVSADQAEDVVQDSLTRALPGIGAGDAELHLRPWLYTIVRNTAFNELRDAGPPSEQLDENYDGVEQPPQALERREELRALLAGLQGLPGAQREALVKREMEGLSHAEIGAQLGVSIGAARQLIFRARNALRQGVGSLVPMPLLRELFDNGGAGGAVAAGGGSAMAVKATVAVLATGAAVTAGVAIKESPHSPYHSRPVPGGVAERAGGAALTTGPSTAATTRWHHPQLTAFAGDGHRGGLEQGSGSDHGGGGGPTGSGDSGSHVDGGDSSGQGSPSGSSDGGSGGGSAGSPDGGSGDPTQATTDGGGDPSSVEASDSHDQTVFPSTTDQSASH